MISSSSSKGWVNIEGKYYPFNSPSVTTFNDKDYRPFGPSMALYDNKPYITWRDNTGHNIHLIKWGGAQWVNIKGEPYTIYNYNKNNANGYLETSLNDNAIIANFSDQQQICIDNNGTVYVAWKHYNHEVNDNCEIFVAKWNGNNWVSLNGKLLDNVNENVSKSVEWSDLPYLLLDNFGKPALSWRDGDNILFIKWNGANWTNINNNLYTYSNAIISTTNNFKTQSKVIFDKNNNPWILWSEEPVRGGKDINIHLIHWNGSSWVNTNNEDLTLTNSKIISSGNGFTDPKFALDSNGNPNILWYEAISDNSTNICLIQWDNTIKNWKNNTGTVYDKQNAVILSTNNLLFIPTFTLDKSNKLIIEFESNPPNIAVTKYNNSVFTRLDDVTFNGSNFDVKGIESSLIFDSTYNPNLCFISSNDELCFLKWASPETICSFVLTPDKTSFNANVGDRVNITISSQNTGNTDTQILLNFYNSNLPASCSGTFSPTIIQAGQSSSLTIDTSCLQPGTYTFMVSGYGCNTYQYTQQITLVVNPKPGICSFVLTPDKTSFNANVGDRVNITISSQNTGNTDTQILLNFYNSNLPASCSGTFSPTIIQAGQSSSLTIDTSCLQPGTYTFMVSGYGCNTYQYTQQITLQINNSCIKVIPNKIDLEVERGVQKSVQFICTIVTSSSGVISGKIVSNNNWLHVTPENFVSNNGVINGNVSINGSELPFIEKSYGSFSIKVDNITCEIVVVDVTVKTDPSIRLDLWVGKNIAKINSRDVTLDAPPFILNERTLVPIRFVSESFGCKVQWFNAPENKVLITSPILTIELFIGKYSAMVNGSYVTLDVAPIINNGRTFLPIRFIADQFKALTEWYPNDKHVVIIMPNPYLPSRTEIIHENHWLIKDSTNNPFYNRMLKNIKNIDFISSIRQTVKENALQLIPITQESPQNNYLNSPTSFYASYNPINNIIEMY